MKIAIGCLIQWYELNIVEDYISSLRKAIDHTVAKVPEVTVIVDFKIEKSTFIEQPQSGEVDDYCRIIQALLEKYNFEPGQELTTPAGSNYGIARYRSLFNLVMSDHADILVWGESDMIVPKEMFLCLHQLYEHNSGKWIATFATCKMWDSSWKGLEHPAFSKYLHSDSPTDWWSVNYVMSYEEMEKFNSQETYLDIDLIYPLKFNGCGLALTSDVIKAGVNVPTAAFFVHEDTAFMEILTHTFKSLPQYHFSNILLVHNRKHPLKRAVVKNETGNTVGERRKSNPTYVQANSLSSYNIQNLFNTDLKFKNWIDVTT